MLIELVKISIEPRVPFRAKEMSYEVDCLIHLKDRRKHFHIQSIMQHEYKTH